MFKNKPYFISEVAQAHDGSLLMAHSMIESSKKSGFDAIKFQAHFAEYESSKDEKFRIQLPYLPDKTRFEYWKRMEFDYYQLNELYSHTKSKGLDYICSPFSEYAVDVLEKAGVDIYKIGSGEFFNLKLIDLVLSTNKKVFISTGLSTWEEISELSDYLLAKHPNKYKNIIFFHCTTSYPCPIEKIGINNISRLKSNLNTDNIGFSDHSGNPNTMIAAYFLGANYFEYHSIYSRDILGFDSSSSITFEESYKLIKDIRYFEELISASNDKNIIANSLSELKLNFSRSLYYACDLPKGTVIQESHLCLKKPGIGISHDDINLIIGRSLKESKSAGELVNKKDIC